MQRVRLLTVMAGPGGAHQPGAELELADAQAAALLAGGYAALLSPAPHMGPLHPVGLEHAVDANVVHAEKRVAFGEMLLSGIDGIGVKTAAKLAEQGIETVAELLMADPAFVANATDASETTVQKWRQRAQAWVEQR